METVIQAVSPLLGTGVGAAASAAAGAAAGAAGAAAVAVAAGLAAGVAESAWAAVVPRNIPTLSSNVNKTFFMFRSFSTVVEILGVKWLQSFLTVFTGTDANNLLEVGHKNFAVTDFLGSSGLFNGLNCLIKHFRRHSSFDFYFR